MSPVARCTRSLLISFVTRFCVAALSACRNKPKKLGLAISTSWEMLFLLRMSSRYSDKLLANCWHSWSFWEVLGSIAWRRVPVLAVSLPGELETKSCSYSLLSGCTKACTSVSLCVFSMRKTRALDAFATSTHFSGCFISFTWLCIYPSYSAPQLKRQYLSINGRYLIISCST